MDTRKKILIVDDNRTTLKLLEKQLTDAGYRVIQANNGRDAVFLAGKEQPDLIISDKNLPIQSISRCFFSPDWLNRLMNTAVQPGKSFIFQSSASQRNYLKRYENIYKECYSEEFSFTAFLRYPLH
ncbi:MAG: response regulator [Deltaproteobacteria bacterium]|nr:response regulator [Deltaproteobacteria bacterium]